MQAVDGTWARNTAAAAAAAAAAARRGPEHACRDELARDAQARVEARFFRAQRARALLLDAGRYLPWWEDADQWLCHSDLLELYWVEESRTAYSAVLHAAIPDTPASLHHRLLGLALRMLPGAKEGRARTAPVQQQAVATVLGAIGGMHVGKVPGAYPSRPLRAVETPPHGGAVLSWEAAVGVAWLYAACCLRQRKSLCAACLLPLDPGGALPCLGGCSAAVYCSPSCRRAAWAHHRLCCSGLARVKVELPAWRRRRA